MKHAKALFAASIIVASILYAGYENTPELLAWVSIEAFGLLIVWRVNRPQRG